MKKLFLLFIILQFNKCYSQLDIIDSYSNWIGEWVGYYVEQGGDSLKENLDIKWIHNNMFLHIALTGYSIIKPSYKYASDEFLTLDIKGDITGIYIDGNGYYGMAKLKGKIGENKLEYTQDCVLWKVTETWEFRDGCLYRNIKGKSKQNNEDMYSKTTFIKKP